MRSSTAVTPTVSKPPRHAIQLSLCGHALDARVGEHHLRVAIHLRHQRPEPVRVPHVVIAGPAEELQLRMVLARQPQAATPVAHHAEPSLVAPVAHPRILLGVALRDRRCRILGAVVDEDQSEVGFALRQQRVQRRRQIARVVVERGGDHRPRGAGAADHGGSVRECPGRRPAGGRGHRAGPGTRPGAGAGQTAMYPGGCLEPSTLVPADDHGAAGSVGHRSSGLSRPSPSPLRQMRILFVLRHQHYTRLFESTIDELGARGHEVHVAIEHDNRHWTRDQTHEMIDRLCARHAGVTRGMAPGRDDVWRTLVYGAREGIDYLRYLRPRYANAVALRARAASEAPALVVRATRWPLVRTRRGIAMLGRLLRWVERAVPDSETVGDFLRARHPDLLLVTPLVAEPSQADYVALRALTGPAQRAVRGQLGQPHQQGDDPSAARSRLPVERRAATRSRGAARRRRRACGDHRRPVLRPLVLVAALVQPRRVPSRAGPAARPRDAPLRLLLDVRGPRGARVRRALAAGAARACRPAAVRGQAC